MHDSISSTQWFIFKVVCFFELKIVYKALTIKNDHKKNQPMTIIHMAVVIN